MTNFKTEEEKRAFKEGTLYAKRYIAFCHGLYRYRLNKLDAVCSFLEDLKDFTFKDAALIPNTEGITFERFCKEYEVK